MLRCCLVLEEKTNFNSYNQSEEDVEYIAAQQLVLLRVLIVWYEPGIGK
jgi:hypothetical protein